MCRFESFGIKCLEDHLEANTMHRTVSVCLPPQNLECKCSLGSKYTGINMTAQRKKGIVDAYLKKTLNGWIANLIEKILGFTSPCKLQVHVRVHACSM